MDALQADAEEHGATFMFNTSVTSGDLNGATVSCYLRFIAQLCTRAQVCMHAHVWQGLD